MDAEPLAAAAASRDPRVMPGTETSDGTRLKTPSARKGLCVNRRTEIARGVKSWQGLACHVARQEGSQHLRGRASCKSYNLLKWSLLHGARD